MPKRAYVIGTLDTKAEELRYVKALLQEAGVSACLVDVSTQGKVSGADVNAEQVAAYVPNATAILAKQDRGESMAVMSDALAKFILAQNDVGGVLGLGGSGNSTLVSSALRALPIGIPKILVSTQAAGNVGPYVGASDICMLYSVTDMAGLNSVSRVVLANAAHGLAGMMQRSAPSSKHEKPMLGLTMFGVTTPCVMRLRDALDKKYDCLVFHATGTGGRSMEKLADDGHLKAVLDITTTEVADLLSGGIFPATEDRFGCIARRKTPWIGSVGAVDMVNFGAPDLVPERYKGRNFYRHNPHNTLMRTTRDENRAIGEWIGKKLNLCDGPVCMLLPEGGVSALDAPGKQFHDPEADATLFDALERTIKQTKDRKLIRLKQHINDPAFADAVLAQFQELVK